MSFSNTNTQTFTLTHAKYLASKVATDLKRIQRFYGYPSDSEIQSYESELTEFVKRGFLDIVTYGFKRNDSWTEPTLRYTSKDLAGMSSGDDDPGKVRPNANVSGAYFTSHISYSDSYWQLSEADRNAFRNTLPFLRSTGSEPGLNGYLSSDKTYSSGGKALDRSSLKSF